MSSELVCPYCQFSKKIQPGSIPSGARWARCPRCRQRFEFTFPDEGTDYPGLGPITPEDSAYEKDESGKGSSWENRSGIGTWQGIYGTFKKVLLSPEAFFRSLTYKGGIGDPLAFGLLVGSIGGMFGFFWQFLMVSLGSEGMGDSIFGRMTIGVFFLALIVIVPVIVLVSMFVYSGILHLMLLIVRGGSNGFQATFRVIAYSQAAQIWGLIPFLGGFVGWIWQLVVQIVGLREIHETSYQRVIMAFLIPVVLLILLAVGVMVMFFMFFTNL